MDNKYLKYRLEDLMDDLGFISWALHGSHREEWEKLFRENPDFRNTALKAKKIISLLKDSGVDLSEEEILSL